MRKVEHIINEIKSGSLAEKAGIKTGDILVSINGNEIEDIFDYQYHVQNEKVNVCVLRNGDSLNFDISKTEDDDLGIGFDQPLMDNYRSCHNKCIFCFIDQLPKGMRETLYFKDDDSRLSFLQGNYITLTNMSDNDVERICKYRLSPINISFQTMNPELRCMMLNNRFAGEALKKVDRFYEENITMNGQIVLCKGVNDGNELRYSIEQLMKYAPVLESVSVVPVGLSRHREGLYPLEAFTSEDAREVISIINEYRDIAYEKFGLHFIHASDEWYITAGLPIPDEDEYDGYIQLENGVGMMRLFLNEFEEALDEHTRGLEYFINKRKKKRISLVTGYLTKDIFADLIKRFNEFFPNVELLLYPIKNDFFGENITVTGLLCGCDIINQLKGKDLGDELHLPINLLRADTEVLLDDVTVSDIQKSLQVPITIVKSSGTSFVESILKVL